MSVDVLNDTPAAAEPNAGTVVGGILTVAIIAALVFMAGCLYGTRSGKQEAARLACIQMGHDGGKIEHRWLTRNRTTAVVVCSSDTALIDE